MCNSSNIGLYSILTTMCIFRLLSYPLSFESCFYLVPVFVISNVVLDVMALCIVMSEEAAVLTFAAYTAQANYPVNLQVVFHE